MLRQLARIGKPLVAVVYTGRPLELGEVMDLADAVLVVWHPGVEAGNALASVVFGDTSPHGRLPMTFPLTTGHIPTSTHQRPTGRLVGRDEDSRLGRYLDDLVFPRLPFGHGLTYTTFDYGPPRLSSGELSLTGGEVELEVDVTNSGDRPAREVVQLYFRDPVAEVTRPLTELLDWEALVLLPGEKESPGSPSLQSSSRTSAATTPPDRPRRDRPAGRPGRAARRHCLAARDCLTGPPSPPASAIPSTTARPPPRGTPHPLMTPTEEP